MSQKDFMGAEDLQLTSSSTDVIISGYENKISQNIASKTLSATKRGEAPDFTKEELLYLNRKAAEDDDTELKVITPAPLVTLKKGKTELNIGHAVNLVQRMEELSSKKIKEKCPTTNSTTICETTKISELPPSSKPNDEDVFEMPSHIPVTQAPEIKTVNKNAYEIREAVLAHALSWVQYTESFKNDRTATEDDVLNVAQKFYRFVENRNNR